MEHAALQLLRVDRTRFKLLKKKKKREEDILVNYQKFTS